MELLYFISGILSAGITYAILLLRKNQTHYTDALASLQSFKNVSSIRLLEVNEDLDRLTEFITEVKINMEKDQYGSVSEINKKMGEVTKMTQAMNVRISENQKILETNISRTSVEINTMRNNLKQLSQDPNFIR